MKESKKALKPEKVRPEQISEPFPVVSEFRVSIVFDTFQLVSEFRVSFSF